MARQFYNAVFTGHEGRGRGDDIQVMQNATQTDLVFYCYFEDDEEYTFVGDEVVTAMFRDVDDGEEYTSAGTFTPGTGTNVLTWARVDSDVGLPGRFWLSFSVIAADSDPDFSIKVNYIVDEVPTGVINMPVPNVGVTPAEKAWLAIQTANGENVANKADKIIPATVGNFAGLDAAGNLTDSGSAAADFVLASGGTFTGTVTIDNGDGVNFILFPNPTPGDPTPEAVLVGTSAPLGSFSDSMTVQIYSPADESHLVLGTGDTDGGDVNLGSLTVTWDNQPETKMGKMWLQSDGTTVGNRGSKWTWSTREDGNSDAEPVIRMALNNRGFLSIGTAHEDPQRWLHIKGSGDTSIRLQTDNDTSQIGIEMGGTSDPDAARFLYNLNANRFLFEAEGAILARLDADGDGSFEIDTDFEVGDFATPAFKVWSDGKIGTNQGAANTNTPAGATVQQLPIYTAAGVLIGYIPIYAAAW